MSLLVLEEAGADAAVPPSRPLVEAERARHAVGQRLPRDRKEQLGQFLTPAPVALQVAEMIEPVAGTVRLLDAGAGAGALTAAVVERLSVAAVRPMRIEVTAFEIDSGLCAELERTLRACRLWGAASGVEVDYELRNEDFIGAVARGAVRSDYTVAVLNPPYRKLRSGSDVHRVARIAGLDTANLYTAFWSAALRMAAQQAQVVAITPRSFCNGAYFQPFREALLAGAAVTGLHVYESRERAFSDDDVLQETVVTAIRSEAPQGDVKVSVSAGPGEPAVARCVPFTSVVHPGDPRSFIRLPTIHDAAEVRATMGALPCTLFDLGLDVSTGRVVDFRAREYLRTSPGPGTVPLIHPAHLRGGAVRWPIPDFRKDNAITHREATRPLLVPNGTYVLVRRFSAKEERRRVVASVYDGTHPGEAVGFENHLNYFHQGGRPLTGEVARGLCVFLNSTLVDEFVREFSGHTQVNAGDLRSLRYPALDRLRALGAHWRPDAPQAEIDANAYEVVTR